MVKPAPTESRDPVAEAIEHCARICEALMSGIAAPDEKTAAIDAALATAAAAIRDRAWDD